MPREIERKFLPANDAWRGLADGVPIRQGYLSVNGLCAVRVRIAADKGTLTVKESVAGPGRLEFEYPLPLPEARNLLDRLALRPLVEKKRHAIRHGGLIWEVDEFSGVNEGLVLIEVELTREDQVFTPPPWVGEEVTHDARYYNANLVANPFRNWPR